MELTLRKFTRNDFEEYASWFKDPELNEFLGSTPDQEWLNHVINEHEGIQYAAEKQQQLVAVIGIVFPTDSFLHHVITDVAVRPDLKRKGLGAEVIAAIKHRHADAKEWMTYVESTNTKALAFFQKNGWKLLSDEPDKHGMLTLTHEGLQ